MGLLGHTFPRHHFTGCLNYESRCSSAHDAIFSTSKLRICFGAERGSDGGVNETEVGGSE